MSRRVIYPTLLTAQELADALDWKLNTVYTKRWRGELEYVRIGRSIRFKAETLQKMIDDNTVPALHKA